MADSNRINGKLPLFIELVGPAGAGKTTLSKALRQVSRDVQLAPDIELRNASHIPVFLSSIPSSLPLLLNQSRPNRRRLTWTELKDIAYLKTWSRVLRRKDSSLSKVILLDQGPVFRMATLHEFGPEVLKSKQFKTWWLGVYEQWASTLDMVIWLDTSDAILMERINTRAKKHDIKGRSDLEAQQFLMQYRRAYKEVLDQLTSYSGLAVLQFDTSETSIEQISNEVIAVCKLKLSAN
jgi:deoxyadenosine/deoxycytidine kinase